MNGQPSSLCEAFQAEHDLLAGGDVVEEDACLLRVVEERRPMEAIEVDFMDFDEVCQSWFDAPRPDGF